MESTMHAQENGHTHTHLEMGNDDHQPNKVVTVKGEANFNPALVFWCTAERCGSMAATFLVKAFYERHKEYRLHCYTSFLGTYTFVWSYRTPNWVDGDPHGRGVFTYPDGTKYNGDWDHGIYHGRGVLTYTDGEKYDGEFKDNLEHGHGVWTASNTRGNSEHQQYEGEWVKGSYHGHGVLSLANGRKYVGGFQHGCFHGRGVLTDANGRVLVEFLKHDRRKKGFNKPQD